MNTALEAVMLELVFGAPHPKASWEATQLWLRSRGVAEADIAYLSQTGLEGLAVYRRLIRGTLRHALSLTIPRTLSRLGPHFERYFDRFLLEAGPRSRYLKDLSREFLDYTVPLWANDPELPSYLSELAEHEALRIELSAMPLTTEPLEARALALDKPVRFTAASRLVHYRHRVHELSAAIEDQSAPEVGDTHLFVYRSPEHDVRYLELTPLAAGFIAHLLGGAPLGKALELACQEKGTTLDSSIVRGSAEVLSDLAERGALRVTFGQVT